jgi:hypothetical protein
MKLTFLVIAILVGIGFAAGQQDEYYQYLNKEVTVNTCNITAFEGEMIAWFPESIVIREICDPSVGNITIKKSCIIWVHEGVSCVQKQPRRQPSGGSWIGY